MPDISMCVNKDCQLANNCYRFKAQPSQWQAYSAFPGGKDCEFFFPLPSLADTIDDLLNVYTKPEDWEIESPYCPDCHSCGEPECCPKGCETCGYPLVPIEETDECA